MKPFYIALAASAMLATTAGYAQNTGGAIGGAAGGAAVGGVVGGPVGAVVGGAAGAITGSALPPQPSVRYERPIVVGEALPDTITYYPVPEYDAYSYVIVNNQRVIVDRRTHRVLRSSTDPHCLPEYYRGSESPGAMRRGTPCEPGFYRVVA
jgi:hypothetical protein